MRQLALAFAAAALLLLVPRAEGYAKGAPHESCADMVPQHGVPPKSPPAPYKLSTAKGADGSVSLTLKGDTPFKGFFVQGRTDGGRGPAVGAFKVTPGARTVNCTGIGSATGVTHSGPDDKSSVTLTWEPNGAKGPITFLYTVARNGGEFWVAEKTEAVSL